jgi:tRNA1Val (adenine37-N6)-methyltransferase
MVRSVEAMSVPSSINLYPTFNYSQPEDYRFSHDSVFLAREIFERHEKLLNADDIQILDLCAGCGIIGLDLIYHQLKERKHFKGQIDFLEIQEIYQTHFLHNLQTIKSIFPQQYINVKWLQKNYADPITKKYDLIISNPPYFLANEGKLSPNEFKNRCRFFLDSDLSTYIQVLRTSLKENGRAYFLLREEIKNKLGSENPFRVRGTWVGLIKS